MIDELLFNNKYIRIMRLDHWIKQLFIIPGIVSAIILNAIEMDSVRISKIALGFVATCCIASSNYVINELLDAKFDQYHPTKKYRPVVSENVNTKIAMTIYFILFLIGIIVAIPLGAAFIITLFILWIMGVVYNVKPLRTKDVPFLDVITESVNNALRLLLGWFIVTSVTIPPSSLIFGYWMSGAFLMAIKRYAEFKMIGDRKIAEMYRKSFMGYTEILLMASSFFYAMMSVFFIGIFLIKYRIEMLLFIPFFVFLYSYYFVLSFKEDSSVQKPEKLYKEKGLMIYVLVLLAVFILCMIIDIPELKWFESDQLIRINGR